MSDKSTFRKTQVKADAGAQPHADSAVDDADFARLEPREQLKRLLKATMRDKPFSELFAVTFDHRAASLMGHVLLDTLEEQGYSIEDFDAVGALTAAAVPLAGSMIHAAASRGQDLDGFVMDFVYPSIKGPSIRGKRVILLDSWLSQKSYVQTSSLVTLRHGNELNLDLGIVDHEQAGLVAIASLVGGEPERVGVDGAAQAEGAPTVQVGAAPHVIDIVNPITETHQSVPFIAVFDERELR